jgi:folate-binding protein YgfZ
MPPTLLFDRSARSRFSIAGPQAVASLNGLVTNDVAALTPGQGLYGAILTAKGKIVADLRVFALGDRLLVDTGAQAAPGLRATFAKYMNPRFATVKDISATMRDIGIFGAAARDVVSSVVGISAEVLGALGQYEHVTTESAYGSLTIAHVPELHIDGYDLFVAAEHAGAMVHALESAGARRGDEQTWNALRVAAGRPEWGVDMDDNTLLQEANFDELNGVSYTKGCYVGQETVARIHFRGHVNRTLRRLRVDGSIELPRGAELLDGELKTVGDVRSVAQQADGSWLAIGMVRREVGLETALQARWDGGTATVHVVAHTGS